jgi:hypothetical protein
MRFFELLNIQHIILFTLPALVFIILLGFALGYTYLGSRRNRKKVDRVHSTFPDGLKDRQSPFPLVLTMIIWGTIIWGLGYIIVIGVLNIKI